MFEKSNVHQLYPSPSREGPVTFHSERESWTAAIERLTADLSHLWERQSRLISAELSEKVTTAKSTSVSLISGGVLLFIGGLTLAATIVLALSTLMQPWVAAAVVGVTFVLVGFVMVKLAQKRISGRELMPSQSLEALNQMKTTFQERIHELKRI